MACKPKLSPKEILRQKEIIKKKADLNKSMEAFSYPSIGMTIYANSKQEADEKIKQFQK